MIIRQLTASFGRLSNETLTLTPGLNVIYAPNEGGKSTWASFIRAMLYGIPTKERDRADYLAEKNRFQPWGGLPLEGTMKITHQGQNIIIRRGPKGAVPFGFFEAVYEDTGEPVPYLTDQGCGEELLGVPREVFERSAFVSQGGHSISSSPQLEERIAALVSTGEELSHSVVEGRLKSWYNRRRHNKTGLIPALEQETSTLNHAIQRQSLSTKERGQLQMELGQLMAQEDVATEKLATLQKERLATFREEVAQKTQQWQSQHQKATDDLRIADNDLKTARMMEERLPSREALLQAQVDLSHLNALKAPIQEAAQQMEAYTTQYNAILAEEEAAKDSPFYGLTPQEALQTAHQADRTWDDLAPNRGLMIFGLLTLILGLVCGGYSLLSSLAYLPPALPTLPFAPLYGYVAGGVLLIFGLVQALVSSTGNRRKSVSRKALLARFHVENPDEIIPLGVVYGKSHSHWTDTRQAYESAVTLHKNLLLQQEDLTQGLYKLVRTFEPQVSSLFGVSAALSRGLTWEDRCQAATLRYENAKNFLASLPTPQQWEAQGEGVTATPTPEMTQLTAQLHALLGEKQRLQEALAHMEGERSALGDPDQLQATLTNLEETLTQRQTEHRALKIAMEALAEANSELQARFSPHLNAHASQYLSALTDGVYTDATLPRSFEPTAKQHDATLPRRAITLSQGTSDQLYLAVRLAICQVLLTPQVPLILDDALTAFDDHRARLAVELFQTMAKERQILLFSCHRREEAWISTPL